MTEKIVKNGRPAKEPESECRAFMKQIAYAQGLTMEEFCAKIGKSGQSFGRHIQGGWLNWNDLKTIADAMGYKVQITFTRPDGVSYSREYDGKTKDKPW